MEADRPYKRRRLLFEQDSPSRRDTVPLKQELHWRRQYCALIRETGQMLGIRQEAICTACVLCHRFYEHKSMLRTDRFVLAVAALFLACKVEEEARRLGKILEAMFQCRYKANTRALELLSRKEFFNPMREKAETAERSLLYLLSFRLRTSKIGATMHPHDSVRDFMTQLDGCGALGALSPEQRQELHDVAWNFANDSVFTLLGLLHPPEKVAAGCVAIASRLLGVQLRDVGGRPWWQALYLPNGAPLALLLDELGDIVEQLLGVYGGGEGALGSQTGAPRVSFRLAANPRPDPSAVKTPPQAENLHSIAPLPT